MDWGARLRGKFENESGAHAGFCRTELLGLLGERFGNIRLLTEDFLRFKYGDRLPKLVLNLLLVTRGSGMSLREGGQCLAHNLTRYEL
jgi:hypothetical protein